MTMIIEGLTETEVLSRRENGQGNDVKLATSRPTKDIILTNAFHPVNLVLYVISLGLFLVRDTRSAFTTVILVLLNAVVGIVQEIRAKRQLDRISLLARTKIVVIREGSEVGVDPTELVVGDILIVQAGDQLPVDGRIVDEGKIEVDESNLTGESDLIQKNSNDDVLSGSICVTGKALVEATGVGEDSFANRLTRNARKFKMEQTPLQDEVNRLLRLILLIVLFFGFLAVLALFVLNLSFADWLQIVAVITGSVSAGLLTLITLNYSWGAVRISQKGGLVQQINAVESLSNVTVLCTDKTGTLTANKIKFREALPIGCEKDELEGALGDFAANASSVNKTSEALIERLVGVSRTVSDEIPFSSARKWSAIAFDSTGRKGVYVLGAMEMLEDNLTMDTTVRKQLEAWSDNGLRVLVFASNMDITVLHGADGEPSLPPLNLMGIVSFSDELRPHLKETLNSLTEQGVRIKVISGDNYQTVAALAKQAGLPGDLKAISGLELEKMSPAEFERTAKEATVFGRITPRQKERLVQALRKEGEYVAMVGDGVNDVLALKKANMGIAMESGSSATRSVAAMILLGDSFEAMPPAIEEGNRIINSIQSILKVYMVSVLGLLLLITGISILGLGFPFTTLQNTLLSVFARALPPLVLALVAVSTRNRESLFHNLFHFTLPASLLLFVFGMLVYIGAFFAMQNDLSQIAVTPDMVGQLQNLSSSAEISSAERFRDLATLLSAQTALTTFFLITGVLMMLFGAPPIRWFAGGAPYRGDNTVSIITGVGIMAIIVILANPSISSYFQLVSLPLEFYLLISLVSIVWVFVQRAAWRGRWLEKLLVLEEPDLT